MHSFFSLTLQSITWLIFVSKLDSVEILWKTKWILPPESWPQRKGWIWFKQPLFVPVFKCKKRFSLFETYQRFYSPVSQKLALCTVLPMISCNQGGMSIFLSLRSCIFTSVKSVCIAPTIHQSVGFRLFGGKKILAMVNYWHKLHVMCHTTSHCWLLQHLTKIIFFLYL